MANLFRRHAELVRSHRAGVVDAPLSIFRAEAPPRDGWSDRTRGQVRSSVVGGTHYTIVRPPLVDGILAVLREIIGAGGSRRPP
jgi:thioesterase domain-containing protein